MTTRRLTLLLVATAFATLAGTLVALRLLQDGSPASRERGPSVQSSILNERRPFFVATPDGYDTDANRRYPVLYVLDGETLGYQAAEEVAILARIGVIPPTIVVAIPNVDDNSRNRDLTPPTSWSALDSLAAPASGADRFLKFLETELIAHVDSAFRTTRPRMIAGSSRSGLFVLYSQVASPHLFDARFGNSPFVWSEEDDRAVTQIEQWLSRAVPDSSFLYLSLGAEETQTMPAFERLTQLLGSRRQSALRWRADVSPGGDQESNPRLSTPVGLCAMFAPSSGHTCSPSLH